MNIIINLGMAELMHSIATCTCKCMCVCVVAEPDEEWRVPCHPHELALRPDLCAGLHPGGS